MNAAGRTDGSHQVRPLRQSVDRPACASSASRSPSRGCRATSGTPGRAAAPPHRSRHCARSRESGSRSLTVRISSVFVSFTVEPAAARSTRIVRSPTSSHRSARASSGRRPAYANTETSTASRSCPPAKSRARIASTVTGASGRTNRLRVARGSLISRTGFRSTPIPDHRLTEHPRDDRERLVDRRRAHALPCQIGLQTRDHRWRHVPQPIAPKPTPNMPLPDPRVTVPRVVRERRHRVVAPPSLHELRHRLPTAIEIERPAQLPRPPHAKLEPLCVRLDA